MGGDVGVLSELNVGSVFWMTARLRLASDGHQSDKNLGMYPLRDTLARSFGGIRVLVAEDEPLNQEVARILLEDAGLVPDMVNNGQKAVELARIGGYQLILGYTDACHGRTGGYACYSKSVRYGDYPNFSHDRKHLC
jgi:hypothetical protein